MVRLDARAEIDKMKVKRRIDGMTLTAQQWLDETVVRTTDPFVPFHVGTLARSPLTSSRYGSGNIIYDTPYAAKMYYGEAINFDRSGHPKASALWFEKSKAVNIRSWTAGVQKILDRGNA